MATFSREVREAIYDAQNGVCFCDKCYNTIQEFHHIVPNTVVNHKLFPLFLQSPFNCVGICQGCHSSHKRYETRVTLKIAEVYESYLRKLIEKE